MISIVVLEGTKVLTDESSLEPLRYAVQQVVKPEDHVVVLVIFNSGDLPQSPVMSSCCIGSDGRKHQPSQRERYVTTLREEISQGTESYMKIFRPFYKDCKNIRVKFMVKIVFGATVDTIISEERNNTGATLVLIGRSFALQHPQWINQRKCRLSSETDDEEIIECNCKPSRDVPESLRVQTAAYLTQKITKFKKKLPLSHDEQKLIYCTLPNFEGIYGPSSSSSPSGKSSDESSHESEGVENIKDQVTSPLSHESGNFLVDLSWEVISEITDRFKNIIQLDSSEGFQMYGGYLEDRSAVFVKRYIGTECRYILVAEKKAALNMYHKNILRLYGYHKNENAMALVFPFTSKAGGALLNRFLNGSWTRELKNSFQNKMNIAIGIAQGLRYMHEECPQGVIVHCDLRPCSVLLGNNLVPQITGFGHAKWLQLDQSSLTRNGCGHMHPSDLNSLELIKSDVLAFGVLLLRLFCSRSAPRDDKSFVKWARSLLVQRAYPILYDESYDDMHGLLLVTSVAARCISTRASTRPCMSKVLSFLKGEVSCAEQTFPSTESSPNLASTPDLHLWEL